MADQEFLASFGVDIDESGVNRLQTILSENTSLSKDLASAFSSAYSGLQSLAAEASDSGSSLSAFQAAQQQAVSVAEEAASAITSLSAAYQGLTGSLPSGTLDLSLGIDGEDRNGTDRDSETNASLLSTIANAVTGLAAADDDGASAAGAGSGSDVNASLDLDFSKADAQIASFLSSAESQFRLSADASGIVSAAVDALDAIQNTYGGTKLSMDVDSAEGDEADQSGNGSAGGKAADSDAASASGLSSGSSAESDSQSGSAAGSGGSNDSASGSAARRSSTGGRFTVPTMVEVAEDGGKEYIIPVDKESIAVPLLRQMMSELSAEARQALTGTGFHADGEELHEWPSGVSGIPDHASEMVDHAFETPTFAPETPEHAPEMSNHAAETSDASGLLNGMTNRAALESPNQTSFSEDVSDAFQTLNQLLSEGMGQLFDGLNAGLSSNPDLFGPSSTSDASGLLDVLRETISAAPRATGVTVQQSTTNNVQAPVNISVTASGSDTEALGRAVYDSAERYLVRTLERVC